MNVPYFGGKGTKNLRDDALSRDKNVAATAKNEIFLFADFKIGLFADIHSQRILCIL